MESRSGLLPPRCAITFLAASVGAVNIVLKMAARAVNNGAVGQQAGCAADWAAQLQWLQTMINMQSFPRNEHFPGNHLLIRGANQQGCSQLLTLLLQSNCRAVATIYKRLYEMSGVINRPLFSWGRSRLPSIGSI